MNVHLFENRIESSYLSERLKLFQSIRTFSMTKG